MSLQHSTPAGQSTKARKGIKRFLRELSSFLTLLMAAAVLLTLFQAFVLQPIRVDGTSMANTLRNGEVVLVSKLDRTYRRGDVVICHYPGRTDAEITLGAAAALRLNTIFVKRLAALPGDTVEIRGGSLFVNGQRVSDPESMGSVPQDYPLRRLGEDEYFVIGDNRRTSHDSRADDVGPISAAMLRGKVKYVLFPLSGIRRVE